MSTEQVIDGAAERYLANKTKWQSRGMMLGGGAFGIEVGMITLEKIALLDMLSPWEIFLVAIPIVAVLGYPMGKFYYMGHYAELEKHNRESYLEEKNNPSTGIHSTLCLFSGKMWNKPGYAAVAFGVFAEGLLVFRGLLSAIAFLCDMVMWESKGGAYDNNIPGIYFWEESPSDVLSAILTVAAVAFSGWVAYSLASGHFALDGRAACEYAEKQKGSKNSCGS